MESVTEIVMETESALECVMEKERQASATRKRHHDTTKYMKIFISYF